MASISFYGRLTRDPELREVGQTQVAKIAVADGDRFRAKPGEQPQSLFHDCEIWGNSAQVAADYLRKGHRVYMSGQLVPNNYTSNKTGETIKANTVKVDNFTLVETKAEASGTTPRVDASPSSYEPSNEEIPF